MTSRFFDPPRPRLFGHRGASGHYPENTLPAFLAALEAGLTYLEMDVRATCDGHVVVHHDADLRRTCGDKRRVIEITLADLKTLDAGYGFSTDRGRNFPFRNQGLTIPTLEEVLHQCAGAFFNIEVKQESPAIEERVLEVISRSGKESHVLLAAETHTVLKRLRPLCAGIPTSLSYQEAAEFIRWVKGGCRQEYHPPGQALQIPEKYRWHRLVSPRNLEAAHRSGLEVHVWTINRLKDMSRLLDMGVDGIMSDYPDLLMEAADKPGHPSNR
jgi:glycerophosphoryl diester phosphodiesterase